MRKSNIRNIAIISHVDHGKTTLLNAMLRQTGIFRANQVMVERVMDSMDLEKERGITIMAKNTAIWYNGSKNQYCRYARPCRFRRRSGTGPQHGGRSDPSGRCQRRAAAANTICFEKSLGRQLPVILVINKIDRSDARIEEVINETYDLFIDFGAEERQIEFPILYTNAKTGVGHRKLGDDSTDLQPLLRDNHGQDPRPGGR